MKKRISILSIIIVLLATGVNVFASYTYSAADVINDTANFIYNTVENPKFGSIGGEWTILGLARSNVKIPEEYYNKYYENVESYIKNCGGVLHEKKYTEYSRVILALTAIGKNPQDVAGYNLLLPLGDYDKTIWQGLNGPIWALIALDCGDYDIPQNPAAKIQATRDMYINRILECEVTGGGWALSESESAADPDITAMALIALSEYRYKENVAEAIDRGLNKLSLMQNQDGGFSSYNSENSESTAQVLAAISSVGISCDDERFIKNGNKLTDNLLSFYKKGSGFLHSKEAGNFNLMATEQCLYAFVSLNRLENNQNTLFNMTDNIKIEGTEKIFGLPGKNEYIICTTIKYPDKTFADIENHINRAAIESLSARGIINGTSENTFSPDDTITRAEFATIVVKSLGVPLKSNAEFNDVKEGDWFFEFVNTAYYYGIVIGTSTTQFNPDGIITREEAAVITARAAELCGMNTDIELFTAKNILAEFDDYIKISDWAAKSLAFCCSEKIFYNSDINIKPKDAITRSEVVQAVYNMLGKAYLL